MPDSHQYVQMSLALDALRQPVLRSAIQALQLSPETKGLDAGCGIGLQSVSLAETVAPAGRVVGLDSSPDLLGHARDIVAKAGLSERVSFREGDVRRLPFDDDSFDWAWSADCVGYAPIEPLPLVRELARVVKPGGSVAILAWSSETLLPGHPLLEARLRATPSGLAPFIKGGRPASHFLRALGWFRDAGLDDATVWTFAADAQAPLTADRRRALTTLLEMRWPEVETDLTQEDRAEYRRLCLPESPDFVVDHPDYYAFFTYTMFHGKTST